MSREPEPVTLTQVIRAAVEAVDPPGSAALDDFYGRFEDADEPLSATSAERVAQRIAEEAGKVDPQEEDPVVQDAVRVATYLVHRRDQINQAPDRLVELARRADGGA
jgi:hypothetical protein